MLFKTATVPFIILGSWGSNDLKNPVDDEGAAAKTYYKMYPLNTLSKLNVKN